MSPLDVACNYVNPEGYNCAAQPNEPCQWMPSGLFHACRIEAATFIENPSSTSEVDEGKFYRAVEDSGLV